MPRPYPKLLEPLQLSCGVRLKNRTVMGSMHTGLEEAKTDPFKKMAAYFAERAKGDVGLIITGGVAPSIPGKVHPFGQKLTSMTEAKKYRTVTKAVHETSGAKIALQILHTGAYSYQPWSVAPSTRRSPISKMPFGMKSLGMPGWYVRKTEDQFAECAALAQEAGFDGVEIMGSEGYLINEFITLSTNQRRDEYGGSYDNRIRFALNCIRKTRIRCGKDFIIVFRLSMIDLVKGGSTMTEVNYLAERVVEAGATIINTGIGWHEARVPTIATSVPRAAWTWVTKGCRDHLRAKGIDVPVVAVNRINTPDVAEGILKRGEADMICMARPFLADAHWVRKAAQDKADEINVCIGCNQACLDHVFRMKTCSCLVNPVACHETELTPTPIFADAARKHFVVVGGGPAACGFAIAAAERGHNVTLYESSDQLGGQFHIARRIPGKDEFMSAITYWEKMLLSKYRNNIDVKLNTTFTASMATEASPRFGMPAGVVVAAGSVPRPLSAIKGLGDDSVSNRSGKVVTYRDVILGHAKPGKRVGVIGAGGIGFDVTLFLTHPAGTLSIDAFCKQWGIDQTRKSAGGLVAEQFHKPDHDVTMFQRKKQKFGKTLGPTTGWIHRREVAAAGVKQVGGVSYDHIDADTGVVTVSRDGDSSKKEQYEFDTVVMCHGQVTNDGIVGEIQKVAPGLAVHRIGGARHAGELDAKRAIKEGHELALSL